VVVDLEGDGMNEFRRLAMRRAHAKRAYYCTCGKTVHGNGARSMHREMHIRHSDGHYYMTATEYERRKAETHKAVTS
jgi:hypothetical protein